MPRITHTAVAAPGNFPALPLTADSVDLTLLAADVSNKEKVALTGKQLVIAQNTDVSARTVTFTSVADSARKRSGDITAYSIGAGEFAVFGPFPVEGWRQTDGMLYFEADNALVKFSVITLP